ncbi:MAG: type II toxin-antitoxin system death-on-curing family toxin [Betaproteobacteria bacterium HGW-Betaproteobacteria-22]|nr:MAG: type II toxin-antitoxin system death-on-curing family toxin [Betaproteobacteria bacterium HGW-Betaproteobacteria-22]
MNKLWIWLDASILQAVHDEQLVEHSGISGVRDNGMFESALAKPQNLAVYGAPDFAELAASYGFGLAKNHPFLDGNKRTAFVAVELFLRLNGYVLQADDISCVLTMLAVASGELDEASFADWICKNAIPR